MRRTNILNGHKCCIGGVARERHAAAWWSLSGLKFFLLFFQSKFVISGQRFVEAAQNAVGFTNRFLETVLVPSRLYKSYFFEAARKPPETEEHRWLVQPPLKSFYIAVVVRIKVTHYVLTPYLCAQITTLYVSGVLNTVLSSEHQKEILRYIYNHQVRLFY